MEVAQVEVAAPMQAAPSMCENVAVMTVTLLLEQVFPWVRLANGHGFTKNFLYLLHPCLSFSLLFEALLTDYDYFTPLVC